MKTRLNFLKHISPPAFLIDYPDSSGLKIVPAFAGMTILFFWARIG